MLTCIHAGKFLNEYNPNDVRFRCPANGWTKMDALVEPYTYVYYMPAFSLNCGPRTVHEGEYSTDVIAQKAQGYIR